MILNIDRINSEYFTVEDNIVDKKNQKVIA